MLLDVAGVDVLLSKVWPLDQGLQQAQVGVNAAHMAFAQRACSTARGLGKAAGLAGHNQFGQQRVEMWRRRGAGKAVGVQAQARARGHVKAAECAAGRLGLPLGVHAFSADAQLNGVALWGRWMGWIQPHILKVQASGHLDLQLHQVQTGDFFGHGVFHLQARVGLDEHPGQIGILGIDQKFESAQAAVLALCGHAQSCLRDLFADQWRQAGTGCNFNQFLKAPLHAAFAFTQTHHGLAVAQHLNFNVPRLQHQSLHIHALDAKSGARLRGATRIGFGQIVGFEDRAHAPPAAAANGFDHDACALLRGKEGLHFFQRHCMVQARHEWHFASQGQLSGAGFVAKELQVGRVRSNEHQSRRSASLRKICAFAQKTIARVNRVTPLGLRDVDDFGHVQIRAGACPLQAEGLASQLHMQGLTIVQGVNGHAVNVHVVCGADQANCNFAPVGDQNFLEHGFYPCAHSQRLV